MKIIRKIVVRLLEAIVVLIMFFGFIGMLTMVIDNWAKYDSDVSRCKRHAVTPYEYHQCNFGLNKHD